MGKYINVINGKSLSSNNKVKELVANGATIVDGTKFIPNLICVVHNGPFEAAAYAYSESEFKCFSNPDDKRRKTWLTHPDVEQLID